MEWSLTTLIDGCVLDLIPNKILALTTFKNQDLSANWQQLDKFIIIVNHNKDICKYIEITKSKKFTSNEYLNSLILSLIQSKWTMSQVIFPLKMHIKI